MKSEWALSVSTMDVGTRRLNGALTSSVYFRCSTLVSSGKHMRLLF